MIVDAIFNTIATLITTVFGVLPSLPPVPQPLLDGANWLTQTIAQVSGVLAYIYGGFMYYFIFALLIALITFEQIYHFTMWIIKKLPIGVN